MLSMPNVNIKLLRERMHLSQEAFARRLGVSLFTIYRWESGKVHPNALARRELAVFLYKQGLIPLGKAREISGLSRIEFHGLLAERNIPSHYTENNLEEDLAFLKKWK